MPRKKVWPPRIYAHHNGQDRIRITTPEGRTKDIWLGKTGTPEAKEQYLRIIAQLSSGNGSTLPERGDRTVDELTVSYLVFSQDHHTFKRYQKVRLVLGIVRDLYGSKPIAEFGPLALEAVQQYMVNLGWSRKYINRMCELIRQCFEWGARKGLIPSELSSRLHVVPGLRSGPSKVDAAQASAFQARNELERVRAEWKRATEANEALQRKVAELESRLAEQGK